MMNERYGREDDNANAMGEVVAGLSRRGLLRTAAGGFALAAGGLFLPTWVVEEAAADNHPVRRVQHRKEQRRRKWRNAQRRNNHRRKRKHSPRKDKLKELYGFRGIQFKVNLLQSGTRLGFEFFQLQNRYREAPWMRQDFGYLEGSKTCQTTKSGWGTEYPDSFLWIDDDQEKEKGIYIRAQNFLADFPRLTLGYGGRVEEITNHDPWLTHGWTDGTTDTNYFPMAEGGVKVMQTDLAYVRVQRLKDSNDFIVFQVDLL